VDGSAIKKHIDRYHEQLDDFTFSQA